MSLNLDRSAWERVKFGDVVRNVNEYFDPNSDGELPYVAGPHIDPESAVVSRWGSTTDDDFPPTFRRLFQSGDVLLHSRGVEKIAAVDRRGVTGEKLFVLRSLDPEKLDQKFLVWLLRSPVAARYFQTNFSGSVNKFLNWTPLAKYDFDLPPLDEQRRIADLLWAVDAERHSSASMVRSALDLESALLNSLVEEASRTRPLKDFVVLHQGRPVPSELYGASGVRLLRAGDLKPRGAVVWSENSVWIPQSWADKASAMMLKPGDLVINMTAQTLDEAFLGRVCEITEGCLLNQRIGRLQVLDPELRDFLFAVLRSPRFTDYVAQRAEGSKVKHMHWRHIEAFPVPDLSGWKSGASEVIERAALAVRQAEARAQSAAALGRALLAGCLGNA